MPIASDNDKSTSRNLEIAKSIKNIQISKYTQNQYEYLLASLRQSVPSGVLYLNHRQEEFVCIFKAPGILGLRDYSRDHIKSIHLIVIYRALLVKQTSNHINT